MVEKVEKKGKIESNRNYFSLKFVWINPLNCRNMRLPAKESFAAKYVRERVEKDIRREQELLKALKDSNQKDEESNTNDDVFHVRSFSRLPDNDRMLMLALQSKLEQFKRKESIEQEIAEKSNEIQKLRDELDMKTMQIQKLRVNFLNLKLTNDRLMKTTMKPNIDDKELQLMTVKRLLMEELGKVENDVDDFNEEIEIIQNVEPNM